MGRRALRKIDPHLDLSRHLLTVDDLPQPCSGDALFDRSAPLEVEIGSGKGMFLERAAVAAPEHDFLGIEVSRKYARFSAARLAKRELVNARMIVGDAERVVTEFLPDEAAIAVHIYFPDPWWKKRHHRRRIMNEQFLRETHRVLARGGTLHFWTDVEEYFTESVPRVLATSLQGPYSVDEEEPQHDLDFRTHFERRKRQAGETIFRAQFRKV